MGSQAEWRKALDELPSTPGKIPSFFFAHGSPMLAYPESELGTSNDPIMAYHGPNGTLATFLKDFGPALLEKYHPKAIIVFSAHWDTARERLVTDYGDNQPLLMDYYGFPQRLYELKFISRGDHELSERIVELYKEHGISARTTSKQEVRGLDGRGFQGPGLDHGVFVPFRLMFGEEFTDIPIVQVSIESSLDANDNWELGKVLGKLREEGVLLLSGGLTGHNLRDRRSLSLETASPSHKSFDRGINAAINVVDVGISSISVTKVISLAKFNQAEQRKKALFDLKQHDGFWASQGGREDHFVPLYIAGGAGEDGEVRVVCSMYGIPTFAFGV